jgi:hypothetical protein
VCVCVYIYIYIYISSPNRYHRRPTSLQDSVLSDANITPFTVTLFKKWEVHTQHVGLSDLIYCQGMRGYMDKWKHEVRTYVGTYLLNYTTQQSIIMQYLNFNWLLFLSNISRTIFSMITDRNRLTERILGNINITDPQLSYLGKPEVLGFNCEAP